jgi:holo-[acyl-carrier protein] synthase
MSIIGLGHDIVDSRRFAIIKNKNKFAKRILSAEELTVYEAIKNSQRATKYLAKRFSCKESVAKAMGVGIGSQISFLDFAILNNEYGKPYLVVVNCANKLLSNPNLIFHISISDTETLVSTTVVIEVHHNN